MTLLDRTDGPRVTPQQSSARGMKIFATGMLVAMAGLFS